MSDSLPRIIVICGPTATGKSDLAVELALRFNGEVISADSRQVYQGLDIGSGKITASEMKGVLHHLLDVMNPKKVYSVELFKQEAEKKITDIIARGKLPIIAGGTGFYIDAVVSGMDLPPVKADKTLRKNLSTKTTEELMAMIQKLDPVRAQTLDPHNKVRIIRAIEIAQTLGKVPEVTHTKRYNPLFIGLTLDTETLKNKIHTRLMKRMDMGMVEEIMHLREQGLSWKRFHEFGLEYRHLALYVQNKVSKEAMLERLEIEIAQYAKRQMQWFKRNKDIQWFKPDETEHIVKTVELFLRG